MTPEQQKWWQAFVDHTREMQHTESPAGYFWHRSDSILSADAELTANRAICKAAREFTAARWAAIVAANCDETLRWHEAEKKANQTMEALVAAVEAADATH